MFVADCLPEQVTTGDNLGVRNRPHRVMWPQGTNDAVPQGRVGKFLVFYLHKGLCAKQLRQILLWASHAASPNLQMFEVT
jgi:hypothetical protein